MDTNKYILLTIDVEDWFQVENFKPWIPFETWGQHELRVEKNVHRLLDLFDETDVRCQKTEARIQSSDFRRLKKLEQKKYPQNPACPVKCEANLTGVNPVKKNKYRIKATFFVLGWLAERIPTLVREIQSRGHEVASHGCNHHLPDQLSADELKQDLTDSKKLLEDITGAPVTGYRAPSFAINDDVLKIIEDCGYFYDSSYNSFDLHGRYGRISMNGAGKLGIAHKISDNFFELAVSNIHLGGRIIPIGGGGYFRLIPGALFRFGIQHILAREGAYLFYMHPWEVDPNQPRVESAGPGARFKHYTNLGRTESRLKQMIKRFADCQFMTCCEYLEMAENR